MMQISKETYKTLTELEVSLWRAETRGDRRLMDEILAEDFFEFGRSGKVWGRDGMLIDSCPPIEIRLPLPAFKIKLLNDETALVTYDSIVQYDTLQYAHRSSIWSFIDGRWRLRFHQGTPYTPISETES